MPVICMTSANTSKDIHDPGLLEHLIKMVAQNDRDALSQLYHLTSASVYGFALSVLKNTHDAEDVLQDCYINIYGAAQSYKPHGKPMAWIITIARNLCLMKMRHYKSNVTLPQEDWEKYVAENENMSQEDKLILRKCMLDLTDEERQIVVLHSLSGFKHREISDMLSIPLPTVLSKHSRALKKLKKLLTKGER